MLLSRTLLVFAAGSALAFGAGPVAPEPGGGFTRAVARWSSVEFRKLESERDALAKELAALPQLGHPRQTARLGFQVLYRLDTMPADPRVPWIEIALAEPAPLDGVALVPASVAFEDDPGPGYGFPRRFIVEGFSSANSRDSFPLAHHALEDFPNPGALPVWFPVSGRTVQRVRITMMQPWRHGQVTVYALGEIMLLQGDRNLATGQAGTKVKAAPWMVSGDVWRRDNLVDGQSVLGAPVTGAESPRESGYLSVKESERVVSKWVEVDLGQTRALEEVRLLCNQTPKQPGQIDYGFPRRFRVTLGKVPEDAEPQLLAEFAGTRAANPGNNGLTIPAHGKAGRYLRVTADELGEVSGAYAFGFSELQAYSGGKNVALHRPVQALDVQPGGPWSEAALTDGVIQRGRLVEWSGWLQDLSRRREVLGEIARLDAGLAARTVKAGAVLQRSWLALAVVAAAGALLAVRRARVARRRAVERLRAAIASDLHDEIGSNLSTIALLSQMARAKPGAGAIAADLARIQGIASTTSATMRDIVWLIRSATPGDLVALLRESAALQLSGLDWTFAPPAAPLPAHLSLEWRRHVFLFTKEALNNVVKHAAARRVELMLSLHEDRAVRLVVRDHGRGFDPAITTGGAGLRSLRQRAATLHAELEIASVPGVGTCLTLTIPSPRAPHENHRLDRRGQHRLPRSARRVAQWCEGLALSAPVQPRGGNILAPRCGAAA